MQWRGSAQRLCDHAALAVAAFLLIAPPLAFGALYAGGRALVQTAAATLVFIWSLRTALDAPGPDNTRLRLPATGWLAALAALLALPLLPLPPAVLNLVSPHTFEIYRTAWPGWPAEVPFAELISTLDLPHAPAGTGNALTLPASWRPVSVIPYETGSALMMAAAYAVFGCAIACYPWHARAVDVLRRLVTALIGLALVEAVYASLQHSGGLQQIFWYRCGAGTSCTGTYLNRNHFAGLLEMVLPLVVARAGMAATRVRNANFQPAHSGLRGHAIARLSALSNPHTARALSLAAVAFILVAALAISSSRAAAVVTLVAFAVMFTLLPSRPRGSRWAPLAALGVIALLWVTSPQLRGRFTLDDPTRRALALETAAIAIDFPLLGVGLGGFANAHPAYRTRTADLWGFEIEHAHNDYLEWLSEVGVPATLLTAGLLIALGRRVLRSLRRGGTVTPEAWLRWGLATGALALLVHSVADFNLHTPANAIVLAFLLGALVRLSEPHVLRPPSGRRRLAAAIGIILGIACMVAIWQQWAAETAYRRVYPRTTLESLTDPPARPAGIAALAALRHAVRQEPAAPHIHAGLGTQLLVQETAATSGPALTDAAPDRAINAFIASLTRAPLQPDVMLDLAGVVETHRPTQASTDLTTLQDLVMRAIALGPYDPRVQIRAAEWHLAHWEQLPASARAAAQRQIAAALACAEQSPINEEAWRPVIERYRDLIEGDG